MLDNLHDSNKKAFYFSAMGFFRTILKKMYSNFRLFIALLCLLTLYLLACNNSHQEKVWVIARDPLWYPLNLTSKEQSMVGFTNDLINAIGNEVKVNIEVISVSTQNLYSYLENGNFDGILWSFPASYYSTGKLDYSQPFYLLGPVLIVPIDSPVTSFEQMGGKIIGIMSDVNPIFNIAYYPHVNLRFFFNIITALDSLQHNQIDGLIAFALPAYNNISALFCKTLKVATAPLTREGLRLVVKKSDTSAQFVAQFNDGLELLKKNGEYQRLLDKWNLLNTEQPKHAQKDVSCNP